MAAALLNMSHDETIDNLPTLLLAAAHAAQQQQQQTTEPHDDQHVTAALLAAKAADALQPPEAMRKLLEMPELAQMLGAALETDKPNLVRTFALAQLARLVTDADSRSRLRAHRFFPAAAAAVADDDLAVASQAVSVFESAAAASPDALSLALDDATLGVLRAQGAGTSSTVALRVVSLFASAAACGDEQLAYVDAVGGLKLVMAAWRSADVLVRLASLEALATLARAPRGAQWLAEQGVLAQLLAIVGGGDSDDALAPLLEPQALHCIAQVLECGGDGAVHACGPGLRARLWACLSAAPGPRRDGALDVLRGLAASCAGLALVLEPARSHGVAALEPLPYLLRSGADSRGRLGALSVVAQLCDTSAHFASDPAIRESDAALRSLVGSAATGTASAADSLAAAVASPLEEVRGATLKLLAALAALEWGAAELGGSEGVLELLLYATPATLTPDELRLKHLVASRLVHCEAVAAQLGEGTLRRLQELVERGPFTTQQRSVLTAGTHAL